MGLGHLVVDCFIVIFSPYSGLESVVFVDANDGVPHHRLLIIYT